jgi:hypothetical protein
MQVDEVSQRDASPLGSAYVVATCCQLWLGPGFGELGCQAGHFRTQLLFARCFAFTFPFRNGQRTCLRAYRSSVEA